MNVNKLYGALLALIFLFGIGGFNIARGIQNISKKRKSTRWGIFRIVIGIPLIILPFLLYFYLKFAGQF